MIDDSFFHGFVDFWSYDDGRLFYLRLIDLSAFCFFFVDEFQAYSLLNCF